MLSSLPFALALLVCVQVAAAAPRVSMFPAGQTMALHRRTPSARTPEAWGRWASSHKAMLMAKYAAAGQPHKRTIGTNLITNQNADSSFFGSLAIGTPPISYNVILDTGSADLWLADRTCTSGCIGIPTFDPSASSTFESKATPFSITYGSGKAAGMLGQDTVQMAGFSVTNQVFGVCDEVSTNLLSSPVSGLLGLAFESIAASGALPFWQALVQGGTWDAPVMSFQLSRYLDDPTADSLEPGGAFTMGFVNSSLFSGDIEYLNLATEASYWILPLTTIRVQGNVMTMPSGSSSFAAIDTGTTLIGGPPNAIADVYAQIPGSEPGSGDFEGFYTYPCDTTVNISLSFGGKEWAMNPKDFHLTALDKDRCLGAFFQIDTAGSAPAWIVGDTFLKNVYSVFRYSPPSVGFATLSTTAEALNGADGPIPTQTMGIVGATVSGTGKTRTRNGASGVWASLGRVVTTVVWCTLVAGSLV